MKTAPDVMDGTDYVAPDLASVYSRSTYKGIALLY
jgi:hypothetical protein